jgi:ribonuclease P protein component
MPRLGFKKIEHLKQRKLIDEMFVRGKSQQAYPLRFIWMRHPEQNNGPHQVLAAVSKRNFRRAVDRNLLKRRIREAYRLHKHTLGDEIRLCLGIIFTGRELTPFSEINEKVAKALQRLRLP